VAFAILRIRAGDQRRIGGLSVMVRKVCGMSERRIRRTPGGVLPLGLHFVWCPKYRRRILCGRVARHLGVLLQPMADLHSWHAVAKEVMPDHVRLRVRVGSADAPAQVAEAFKRRTARTLSQQFPFLHHHAKVLWSPSRFATSFGYVSESTVRRYIDHRWDAVA
jgi:putative transposase